MCSSFPRFRTLPKVSRLEIFIYLKKKNSASTQDKETGNKFKTSKKRNQTRQTKCPPKPKMRHCHHEVTPEGAPPTAEVPLREVLGGSCPEQAAAAGSTHRRPPRAAALSWTRPSGSRTAGGPHLGCGSLWSAPDLEVGLLPAGRPGGRVSEGSGLPSPARPAEATRQPHSRLWLHPGRGPTLGSDPTGLGSAAATLSGVAQDRPLGARLPSRPAFCQSRVALLATFCVVPRLGSLLPPRVRLPAGGGVDLPPGLPLPAALGLLISEKQSQTSRS